jgi:3-phosphoshikimate 1-carboxyvinyltransferase
MGQPLHELPDPLPIPALARGRGPFSARIRPPGSKSLTNRALLLAALASGTSRIHRPLLGADDTDRMIRALTALGAQVRTADATLDITGVGGRWKCGAQTRLDLGNAGTATRFLAAASLLAPAPIVIDGNDRMRQRPIGELTEALAQLGVVAEFPGAPGCPPVRLIPPPAPPRGATLTLRTTQSSQFISALLLVAPWLPGGLTLRLEGEVTSRSYVQMTVGLLDALGGAVRTSDDLRVVRVSPPPPAPFSYTVEPDASGATYFWAAPMLFPGAVCRVEGLDNRSLQGDAQFPDLLARMGGTIVRDESPCIGIRGPASIAPVMADLSDMPDAAMTLAAVACFASGRSLLRGLRTLRVKETDRIAALQTELAKVGVKVDTNVLGDPDAITITPPPGGVACAAGGPPIEFDTYDDHRMAMSLALIGLRRPNTFVRNPACVAKTYPAFWRDLASLH